MHIHTYTYTYTYTQRDIYTELVSDECVNYLDLDNSTTYVSIK